MSTNSSASAAPQIFGFHATTEAAVASSAAMQGLLGLMVIKDNSETLGAQIATMSKAGISEAGDARSELRWQAAGTMAQALGQFASAAASCGSAVASHLFTSAMSKQQGALQEQLGESQSLQDQFRAHATGEDKSISTISDEDENESIREPSTEAQNRIEQLVAGKSSNASAVAMSPEEYAGLDNKRKSFYSSQAASANEEALAHMPANSDEFKGAKEQLDDKTKGLITQVNTLSNQIQGRQSMVNLIGQSIKEVAGAMGSTGQASFQVVQSKYACDKQLMSTVSQLTNQEMGVLSKMTDAANQSVDSSMQMVLQAAQITSSAA